MPADYHSVDNPHNPHDTPPTQLPRSSCPMLRTHAHGHAGTGWIGERTSTCAAGVARALRPQTSYRCAVDGHCSYDTLMGGVNETASAQGLSPPVLGRALNGVRLLVLLRDPVARCLSEFRHVWWGRGGGGGGGGEGGA